MTIIDIPIIVPDFSALSDDDLHAWEFRVYDQVPGTAELHEIIGRDAARMYYQERGRRIDAGLLAAMDAELAVMHEQRSLIMERLSSCTSGGYHFSSEVPDGEASA